MPMVREGERAFEFAVTARLLQFFDDHWIGTTAKRTLHRWKEGDIIVAAQDARFHRHTLLLSGQHVTQLQSFSYAFSAIDHFTTLGRYCSIAQRLRLIGPEHPTHFVTSSELLYRPNGLFADVFRAFGAACWTPLPPPARPHARIGHDVWIGQDVLLKEGVSVGTGAVIAAGAVVVKDVAPYEMVGGVPARRIRMRFESAIVQGLLALEWWNYAIPQLPQLPWDKPALLIEELSELVSAGEAKPFHSDLGSVREVIQATD